MRARLCSLCAFFAASIQSKRLTRLVHALTLFVLDCFEGLAEKDFDSLALICKRGRRCLLSGTSAHLRRAIGEDQVFKLSRLELLHGFYTVLCQKLFNLLQLPEDKARHVLSCASAAWLTRLPHLHPQMQGKRASHQQQLLQPFWTDANNARVRLLVC